AAAPLALPAASLGTPTTPSEGAAPASSTAARAVVRRDCQLTAIAAAIVPPASAAISPIHQRRRGTRSTELGIVAGPRATTWEVTWPTVVAVTTWLAGPASPSS